MKKTFALAVAALSFAACSVAQASAAPEDSGVAAFGGYTNLNIDADGESVSAGGYNAGLRATFAMKQGPFAKVEYTRSGVSKYGIDIDGDEIRVGAGYAIPVAANAKVYGSVDFVNFHLKASDDTGSTGGTSRGFLAAIGGSVNTSAQTAVYGRAGYYRVSSHGTADTGPDIMGGLGISLSKQLSVFAEVEYLPLSEPGLDLTYTTVKTGLKLQF